MMLDKINIKPKGCGSMSNGLPLLLPVLYTSSASGALSLTATGMKVTNSKDLKYLDNLRQQFDAQHAAAKQELADYERTMQGPQAEYERRDEQIRRDLRNGKITFETARDQINGLGDQPMACSNLQKYWSKVAICRASRDLVAGRIEVVVSTIGARR